MLETIDLTTVQTIGEYAFSENMKLSDVTIPVSVTEIETHAFASSGVATFTLNNELIGDHMFYDCQELKTILRYLTVLFFHIYV